VIADIARHRRHRKTRASATMDTEKRNEIGSKLLFPMTAMSAMACDDGDH